MRAMMMKVNYDPRYVAPHQVQQPDHPRDCIQRLARARGIYDQKRNGKESGSKPVKHDVGKSYSENNWKHHHSHSQGEESANHKNLVKTSEALKHKEGVAKAHLELQQEMLTKRSQKINAYKSPYSEKLRRPLAPQNHNNSNLAAFPGYHSYNVIDFSRTKEKNDPIASSSYCRSQSLPQISDAPHHSKSSSQIIEKEKQLKKDVDKAIREKKVFTIVGPYHGLRRSLRKRGWIEKFLKAPPPSEIFSKKKDQVEDTYKKLPPWQEENGLYGLMSHMVRNSIPSFVFTVKTVDVDKRVMKSTQLVNHFSKAGSFTTKAGLCQHLRDVPWFYKVDPDTFYPRCYKVDDADDKNAFWENYKMTSCISLVRCFVIRYENLIRKAPQKISDLEVVSIKVESVEETLARQRKMNSAISRDSGVSENSNTEATKSNRLAKSNRCTKNNSAGHTARRKFVEYENVPEPNSCETHGTGEQEVEHTSIEEGQEEGVSEEGGGRTNTGRSDDVSSIIMADNEDEKTEESDHKGEICDSDIQKELEEHNDTETSPKPSVVSVQAVEFAMQQCEQYLKFVLHEDLDSARENQVTEVEWEIFFTNFRKFVIDQAVIHPVTAKLVYECEKLVVRLRHVWVQYELDGYRNIWILKPGAMSRGRGIVCTDSVHKIKQMIEDNPKCLVVQKYMETPLLVHNIKFDIRQWFLVTDWNPLTIWYYGDCYLRFCSQEYTLDNMHESIHLSNNSVQKNYRNGARSASLPEDNMWFSHEFDQFLREQGYGDAWSSQIVPGMKKSILCSMLCTQDRVEDRKSAFELYGADFMITEDLQPWLLEINSSPSMCVNTRVMEKLVEAVLDDMVKVVIDRREDRTCDTGGFQLLYKQSVINNPPGADVNNLKIHGRKIRQKWTNSTS